LPAGEHAHIAYLSDRMRIRHRAVELVDRLEAKGWRQAPDHDDRRRVFVSDAPVAERAVRRLARHHVRELQSSRELVRSLNALVRKMDGA
jgi:DNA-binding MarR family transcriptional regulator